MRLRKFLAPACAGLFIFNFHALIALGQGTTAFTYQGRLVDNGTNAEGTNGMIFTLYSAATGGTVAGTPITNSVAVSNGLFTADLDFGTGAFSGSARWLDIAVSNGTTNVELSPRAPVLPTPYAIYAASAATAGTATSATTAGTATNIVGGVVATGTFAGNGGGLTNVPATLQMAVFTSSGTFIVPTNVWTIIVEAWGGGGGGGAGSTSSDTGGGGGGAGGYGKEFFNVIPGANYTVTVGAGGSAGSAGGGSGIGGVTLGGGGSPGNTDVTPVTPGGTGGSGPATSSTASAAKGGNGKYGTVDGGGDGGNAAGGGSGGLGNLSGTATGGTAGNAPGGGGGGGDYTISLSGYAGGNGEVIVYY